MSEPTFIPAAAAPIGGPYPQGQIGANYPRNQWWVIATAAEITREPLQRWALDLPVVLYRREDGRPVALDDRCPHRWAPLSKGWLEGDELVCGYHGLRFAPEGQCVKVPTQAVVPAKACVHAYPLIERGPFVWIWTGDPTRATESQPPAIDWTESAGWSKLGGYMAAECNYMLLKENVLDLTHFGYVHRNTFKILDWDRAPTVKVENGEGRVPTRIRAGPAGAHLRRDHRLWRQADRTCQLGPQRVAGLACGRPGLHRPRTGRRSPQHGHLPRAARHHTRHPDPHALLLDGSLGPAAERGADRPDAADHAEGFQEDKDMLEAIQAQMLRDPRGLKFPEVMVNSDQPGVQARRQLKAHLDRDAG